MDITREEQDQMRALRIQELRKRIGAGLDSLRRGEGVDGDEFFRTLEKEEQQLAKRRRA